jgi:hypothetical protein
MMHAIQISLMALVAFFFFLKNVGQQFRILHACIHKKKLS